MADGNVSPWSDLGPDSIPGESADPRGSVVVVIWTGQDAERIRRTAALLGCGPRDMIRWAVARTIEESTFITARERALLAHDLGPGGRA
jgi:hypothetical protein